MPEFTGKHILIIVENLPVPLDKRVWQEANALRDKKAEVSIICPKMKGYNKSFEVINGIQIYRHPLPFEAQGSLGYLLEYGTALFFEFFLALKLFFSKKFDVIQGCSPPDLIFLVALPFKLFGVKYVFDHHDLSPELFYTKFKKKNFLYKLISLFEKLTFKTANYSISTNNSFKEIATTRGNMPYENVAVVRSGPDLKRLNRVSPNLKHKMGKHFLIGYLGVIAEQDGLDLLIKIADLLLKKRNDIHFAIMGDGTELENVKNLVAQLGIQKHFTFFGMVTDDTLLNEVLNSCDVCVNPDVPDDLNNLLTTNKVMEYMAVGKPVVQFDLKEGRYSAQEASLYAKHHDLNNFADCIAKILDNPTLAKTMGEFGFNRVRNQLSWDYEKQKLISFYDKVLF